MAQSGLEEALKIYNNLFEVGGIAVSSEADGGHPTSSITSEGFHSLETIIRAYDFERNGFRPYMHDYNIASADHPLTVEEILRKDKQDIKHLEDNLHEDSYKAAIGGQVELDKVNFIKLYAEMTGKSQIPIEGDSFWDFTDGNGFTEHKTGENVFKKIGKDEGSYHSWLDRTYSAYSMAE